jgi:hypothetical protein
MERMQLITDKDFCEFCYRRFRECTEEELGEIPKEYDQYFVNDRSLYRFCHNAPKEVLDYILTKIGVSWVQVYGPNEKLIAESIFNSYDLYEYPRKGSDLAAKTADSGVFALGSREVIANLHMLAHNSHTEAYSLSSKAKEIIRMRAESTEYKIGRELENANNAYGYFNKLFLVQIAAAVWFEREDGIKLYDMYVLTALFDARPGAMSRDSLLDALHQNAGWKRLGVVLESLEEKNLIITDKPKADFKADTRNMYYMITEKGITLMMNYRNQVATYMKKMKEE